MCKFFAYFAVCATVNCAVKRQRPVADRFNHPIQCRACMSVMSALKGTLSVFSFPITRDRARKRGKLSGEGGQSFRRL
jgi:hypothetical protein